MRIIRTLALGVAALASAVAITVPGFASAAKASSSVRYVALGDSYSSGVGTGSESGSCLQSPTAYGPLWAAANSPASFTFGACSGAKIPDVESSQLSDLSSSTTLVSLTIGGNDIGFSSIMGTCYTSTESACESAVSSGVSTAQNTLPGELSTLFSDIRADAPNAEIVLLGYPDFYDTSVSGCADLNSTETTDIDNGINTLDSVLKSAAASAGAKFGDVRSKFAGHELCDTTPWLHDLDTSDTTDSFHPTAAGQSGAYLPVFSSTAGS